MASLVRRRSSAAAVPPPNATASIFFPSRPNNTTNLHWTEQRRRLSHRQNKYNSNYYGLLAAAILLLLFVAPWWSVVHSTYRLHQLQSQLKVLQHNATHTQQMRHVLQEEFKTMQKKQQVLQDDNTQAIASLQNGGDGMVVDSKADDGSSIGNLFTPQLVEAQAYESALLAELDTLQAEIGRASARTLRHRQLLFQTIRVEVELAHDTTNGGNGHPLVITLASTTLIPHAISTFLHNLDLYAGWSLHVAHHHQGIEAVQAVRPGLFVATSTTGTANANLHQIAIRERVMERKDIPLRKYAVLFKDMGPNFWIRMQQDDDEGAAANNNETHVAHNNNDDKDAIVIGHVTQGKEILDYIYARGAMVSVQMKKLRILPPPPKG